jgi:predicted naringenin-chalcone synthase
MTKAAMKKSGVDIIALGTAVPTGRFSQARAAAELAMLCENTDRQRSVLNNLFNRSGIRYRSATIFDIAQDKATLYTPANGTGKGPTTEARMQRYEEDVLPLAIESVTKALSDSKLDPCAISHLVTVSCTGFAAPGFDLGLIGQIPLQPGTHRTHVGFMGCHGMMNGMRVARAFVEADPDAIVLLCGSELCSLHFQYGWESDNIVANSLFADGAAAMIFAAPETLSGLNLNLVANDSYVIPGSADYMTWKIQDHGFAMTLAAELPLLVSKELPAWINSWLKTYSLSTPDIGSWAVHPGGKRILDAVENSLGLDSVSLKASRKILSEYGNMSSPTVLFILQELLATELSLPLVMLGFGPGVTIEAALFV